MCGAIVVYYLLQTELLGSLLKPNFENLSFREVRFRAIALVDVQRVLSLSRQLIGACSLCGRFWQAFLKNWSLTLWRMRKSSLREPRRSSAQVFVEIYLRTCSRPALLKHVVQIAGPVDARPCAGHDRFGADNLYSSA